MIMISEDKSLVSMNIENDSGKTGKSDSRKTGKWVGKTDQSDTGTITSVSSSRKNVEVEVVVAKSVEEPKEKNKKAGGEGGGDQNAPEVESPVSNKRPSPDVCDEIPVQGGRFFWGNSGPKTANNLHYEPPKMNSTSKRTVCGPRIVIAGMMKCGTNTIGDLVTNHPRVTMTKCMDWNDENCDSQHYQGGMNGLLWEMHGFTHKLEAFPDNDLWLDLYGQTLPTNAGKGGYITVDKSPSYFNTERHPDAARLIHDVLPHAKVIVTLCDPTERLYSQYNHEQREETIEHFQAFYRDSHVPIPTNFSEFVWYFDDRSIICQQNPAWCDAHRLLYLKTGEYETHYQKFISVVGADNLLVLNMKDHLRDNARKVLQFIGEEVLPSEEYPWDKIQVDKAGFTNKAYEGRSSAWSEHGSAMRWLDEHYAPFNKRLSEAIGESWPMEWSSSHGNNRK